jgi:hypothetical protein
MQGFKTAKFKVQRNSGLNGQYFVSNTEDSAAAQ